jgi:hypothetical protein
MKLLFRSTITVFVLCSMIIVLSGAILNHKDELRLNNYNFNQEWILSYYHLDVVEPDVVYLLEQNVISQFEQQVFVDANPVLLESLPLRGGINLDDVMILATRDSLIFISKDGQFLDQIGAESGIPPFIQNIGTFHGEPVVQTRDGMWRSDFMLEKWEKLSLEGVSWSVPQPMPDVVTEQIATYFHGHGISLERLLSDINTGSLFGVNGIWIVDIATFIVLIFVISGLIALLKKR